MDKPGNSGNISLKLVPCLVMLVERRSVLAAVHADALLGVSIDISGTHECVEN